MSRQQPIKVAARAAGNIGSYNIVVPAQVLHAWKRRARFSVPCPDCNGEGCRACFGKGEIAPYISLPHDWQQTRVLNISFSFEELAWALGGLDSGESSLIMCKYIHSETPRDVLKGNVSISYGQDKNQLIRSFLTSIANIAETEDWPVEKFKHGILPSSCLTAIDEVLSGGGSWLESRRAAMMGVSRTAYYKYNWRSRYARYMNILEDWESRGLASMYWRLNE